MATSFKAIILLYLFDILLGIISLFGFPALACWSGFVSIILFIGIIHDMSHTNIYPRKNEIRSPKPWVVRIIIRILIPFFAAGFYGFYASRGDMMSSLGITAALKNFFVVAWFVEFILLLVFLFWIYQGTRQRIQIVIFSKEPSAVE